MVLRAVEVAMLLRMVPLSCPEGPDAGDDATLLPDAELTLDAPADADLPDVAAPERTAEPLDDLTAGEVVPDDFLTCEPDEGLAVLEALPELDLLTEEDVLLAAVLLF